MTDTGALTVAFRTLGCKVNRVESERIAAQLLGRGCELTAEEDAQVVVINTCTVTGEADAKARKAVRHVLALPRSPVVVVTGCLAAIDANGLRALGPRVVVESDKEAVAAHVAELLGVAELSALAEQPGVPASRRSGAPGFRTRAMVKVEDGCDNRCSYCIVPDARGLPRSTPLADVATEVSQLVADGVREVVLTGINIGRYDDQGEDLADLIDTVANCGVERIRLSSIEPPDLSERLLKVLANTPAFCPHLHVPLQSGSDAVLRAMNRTYTAEEYLAVIEASREALPGLAVTTDVIAGFPSETNADASLTLDLIEQVGFAKLHVFRYSRRPGTPAADMVQVAPPVTAERAAALRETGDRLRAEFVASRAGTNAQLLVESIDGTRAIGTTREYLRVVVQAPLAHIGDVLEVVLATAGDVSQRPDRVDALAHLRTGE